LATVISSREVTGPEVTVDTHDAIAIAPPLSGPGWASLNGCCVPNIHRNVRIAAGTRIATPETFAIDWIQVRGDKFFEGEGAANAQYPYFGAEVKAVADGEVIALHDGMEESEPMEEGKPFMRPQTVLKPEDYGGNYVLVRIKPDVYAFYAHLQPGTWLTPNLLKICRLQPPAPSPPQRCPAVCTGPDFRNCDASRCRSAGRWMRPTADVDARCSQCSMRSLRLR
jgi:hypothetical protein